MCRSHSASYIMAPRLHAAVQTFNLRKNTAERNNRVIILKELATKCLNYVNAVQGNASNAINHK